MMGESIESSSEFLFTTAVMLLWPSSYILNDLNKKFLPFPLLEFGLNYIHPLLKTTRIIRLMND